MKHLLLLLALVLPLTLHAQQDSTETDSTDRAPSGIRAGRRGFSISSGSLSLGLFSKPSISLHYGFVFPNLKGVGTSLASPRLLELRAGSLSYDTIPGTLSVAKVARDGLFVGIFSPEYGGKADSLAPFTEGVRGGLFFSSGYSYMRAPKEPSLTLLHDGGLVWTSLSMKKLPLASPDSAALAPFSDNFRFGNQTGFSLRYNVTDAITLDASYERTLMYNGFSFFSWIGSTALEGIAQGVLTGMVIGSMEEKSPSSVAVANLILRSALSFAIYELRRGSQYFPFGGNNPLCFDVVRVGMSFNF